MRLEIWSPILKVSVAHFYRHMPIIVVRLQSFRTSILTLCIYDSELRKCFFVFVGEQR